ncbi:MAG: PepSY domain-containing protein [Chromatiales bacterium]|jgi:uncharacterized membrane protein YkoI
MRTKVSVLLCSLLMIQQVTADSDHYEARRLMEAGTILPLETVLESVRQQRSGRILEVELEERHDRYIYEIEMLDQAGRVWEMRIDAVTGRVLKSEQED